MRHAGFGGFVDRFPAQLFAAFFAGAVFSTDFKVFAVLFLFGFAAVFLIDFCSVFLLVFFVLVVPVVFDSLAIPTPNCRVTSSR